MIKKMLVNWIDDGCIPPSSPKRLNPVAPVGGGNSRMLIGGRADHGSRMGRRYKYVQKSWKILLLLLLPFSNSSLYSSQTFVNSSHTLSKWARKLLSSLLVSWHSLTLVTAAIGEEASE